MYMMYYSIPGYILYMCACCAIHHLQGRGGGGGGLARFEEEVKGFSIITIER